MNTKILIVFALFAFSLTSFVSIYESSYKIDVDNSVLKWTGFHLGKSYEHNGNIKLKSGNLVVESGKITGGDFVIDMTSITNNDLTGAKNTKLVDHLKSDDFFNTEKYPEARLVISKIEGAKATGEVTIRGITAPISFEFSTEETSDNKIVATATLSIDRTKHEVSYGWTVENAMLSNEFRIDVKLVATK